jgi:ribonuclease D
LAKQLDRATFRVIGNEVLLDIVQKVPSSKAELGGIKGISRGVLDRNASELLQAIQRGLAVPESELPKFPRAARWDRDPEFDAKVSKLKTVRDAVAERLGLDPGVLCARERLEAVVRKRPTSIDDLAQMPELRRWQIGVLGAEFVGALNH